MPLQLWVCFQPFRTISQCLLVDNNQIRDLDWSDIVYYVCVLNVLHLLLVVHVADCHSVYANTGGLLCRETLTPQS